MQSTSLLIQDIEQTQHELDKIDFHKHESLLIQVFSSFEKGSVLAACQVIKSIFPNAKLIGCSANHYISQGVILHQGLYLIVTRFDATSYTCGIVEYSEQPLLDSGMMAEQLQCHAETQSIICFADCLQINNRALFAAFEQSRYSLPICGGASTITEGGRWVMLNGVCYENAYVMVALHSSKLAITKGYYTEWNPIGRTFRVTGAQDNRLAKLDGIPIRDLYNRYLADGLEVPFEQLHNFPLMVGDPKEQNIHLPLEVMECGEIEFSGQFQVGDEVRFCYDHPSLTLEQVRLGVQQIASHKPEQLFIYNCTSRIDFIDGNQEVEVFQKLADTYGVYCMGELYQDTGQQRILHHSLTYLALREGEGKAALPLETQPATNISPLFSLIRNALLDVDDMNNSMASKIQQQATALTASYRIDRRTGLPNRSVLREALSTMSFDSHLLTLKVTTFGQINEKYGYRVGDKLLHDLSEYLQKALLKFFDESCQLYSIGIGEWAVVFDSWASQEQIHQRFSEFADQTEHVNFEPMGLPDIDYLSVSVCAGVASRRDFPTTSIDDLLLKAIEARRSAVSQNKHLVSAKALIQLEKHRQEQLGWLSCVSRAVLNQNIVACSQPIVSAHSHQLESYECLVRIEEDGQLIAPGKFLPIIEGTHLYTRLSRQMITRTFDFMSQRTDSFSINLAPQDFSNEKTILHLEQAIKKISHPQRIGLEVLETEQIQDYGRLIEVCNHFRDLGVNIIVDDFGSGYSNIDEILKLEPQVIKLDGSLIRNIDKDKKQRKIAQQLVSLCHILNAKTVAEFVHNEQVCRIAEDMGVDYLQGYHFGEPKRLF
ncbi:EAL domain-containing protein [Vibrio cyclitrophicus]|uniref:bifunctional diguanylate cyclase/phosphodiesterase n=1 Tax=Vibrio TaxID=662 RepID=UPI000307B49C|nr:MULTISPECIES: EAL domain-containing protein [Vibrio]MBE8554827.1 EAL domain-containing protein [Vibrio sp. OPT24]MCC4775394.1 EAL domain-containing protein [Vibrio cyclitrophicus]MCC4840809.1 EAL domain-containing protein [Vibrio cyclitrophicus]NOH46263.1 EAL domain-containing protein [Vibrio cyclitrophicus]OED95116.1 diguanylate cyclase [Vibrio cyclitrophicus ZF28]